MKLYIEQRVFEVAEYILKTNATVRQAGKKFCLSKSTVHKDMQQRLKEVDIELWKKVQYVLRCNLAERHIRGGIATQKKFAK